MYHLSLAVQWVTDKLVAGNRKVIIYMPLTGTRNSTIYLLDAIEANKRQLMFRLHTESKPMVRLKEHQLGRSDTISKQ